MVGLVANHAQLSDTLLEVGCGHGHDAVELAKLGHRVVATDISKTAVGQAFNLAREQGVSLDCLVMDVFNRSLLGQTIDVVYEKGVLHTFFDATSRAAYIDAVSELIPEGGLWISVSGSDQSVDPEDDPDTHAYPRLSSLILSNPQGPGSRFLRSLRESTALGVNELSRRGTALCGDGRGLSSRASRSCTGHLHRPDLEVSRSARIPRPANPGAAALTA